MSSPSKTSGYVLYNHCRELLSVTHTDVTAAVVAIFDFLPPAHRHHRNDSSGFASSSKWAGHRAKRSREVWKKALKLKTALDIGRGHFLGFNDCVCLAEYDNGEIIGPKA